MRNIPVVTRNLLLINLLVFLLDLSMRRHGIMLSSLLGLHFVTASGFHWWQPFTYMFLHADFGHLFCNMFAVWMFGPVLEREWGTQKYLFYYLVCGLGAAIAQEAVWAVRVTNLLQSYPVEVVTTQYIDVVVTIGASGAVFGILLAFGWLFPDIPMFLLFLPIPIRARTFVIIYAAIELFAGFSHITGDNVAHFAHLGGMLFGLLLLLLWKKGDWKWPNWHMPWRRYPRLDSSKDKDYSSYHYQRRVDEPDLEENDAE